MERYQRRFQVLRSVLAGSHHQQSGEGAVSALLSAVCQGFGWSLGMYLSKTEGDSTFTPTAIRFSANGPPSSIVRMLAERPREETASLFDAVILRDRTPKWIPNVTLEPSFTAAKHAVALGVRGLVGIPISANGRIYGIAEFFTREEFNPSRDQIEFLAGLGQIVGTTVHFRELDRTLAKIRHEQETVFRQVQDVVYIVDRSGRATFLNEPAERLFGRPANELIGQDIHGTFHASANGMPAVPAAECPLHGLPGRTLDSIRRRETFRTATNGNVEVEAVAAPFVINGKEDTLIVLRIP